VDHVAETVLDVLADVLQKPRDPEWLDQPLMNGLRTDPTLPIMMLQRWSNSGSR
jgi:hypothetical protein